MYRRIVVPVEEGSNRDSLAHAKSLARRLNSSLELIHVHRLREAPVDQEGLTQYRFQNIVDLWDARDADAELEEVEWLSELASALASTDPTLAVSSRVLHAPVMQNVRRDDERVLVVSGAHADRIAELDDATRELIRGGDVPILLVPPEMADPERAIRHIVVALDGSHFSEEILAPSLELAAATGAGVTLIEVVTPRHGLGRLLHRGDRTEAEAWRTLDALKSRIPGRYWPIGVRVVTGDDPAEEIVAEADRSAADIIALATHGRGGVMRALLGSVAERVIATAGRPVLVYRPVRKHASVEDRLASV